MNIDERIRIEKEKMSAELKECRQAAKLSQQELADKLNISVNSIAKLESGKSLPKFELYLKVLFALGAERTAINW